jgi:hypothetical protein
MFQSEATFLHLVSCECVSSDRRYFASAPYFLHLSNDPRGRRAKKLVSIAILCLLVFLVLFTPAKITFDVKENRVSVSSLFLMIPQHCMVPFASVRGAKVSVGRLTSTLVPEQTDGSTEQITEFFRPVWMLDEAAMKINAFLRHHGRKWDQLNCCDSVATISSCGNASADFIVHVRFVRSKPRSNFVVNSCDSAATICSPYQARSEPSTSRRLRAPSLQ